MNESMFNSRTIKNNQNKHSFLQLVYFQFTFNCVAQKHDIIMCLHSYLHHSLLCGRYCFFSIGSVGIILK